MCRESMWVAALSLALASAFACGKSEEPDAPPVQFGQRGQANPGARATTTTTTPAAQPPPGQPPPPSDPGTPPPSNPGTTPGPSPTLPPLLDAGVPGDAGASDAGSDAGASDGGTTPGPQGCLANCQAAMQACMMPKIGQLPDPAKCNTVLETCRKACF